jgi:hypothetical protein
VCLGALAGCGPLPDLGDCGTQLDLTGSWVFSLTPDGDTPIPRPVTIAAELRQVRRVATRFLYGTLTADDTGFFDPLTIPELVKNNGTKTGSTFRCVLQINVPTASQVSDDNEAQEPMRISLGGTVVGRGQIAGKPESSSVILVEDATMMARSFTWSGTQR